MSKNKLKRCDTCGYQIAKKAKTCPYCGAKNKQPFYRQLWFIILLIMGILMAFSGQDDNLQTSRTSDSLPRQMDNSGDGQVSSEVDPTYRTCTVEQMERDLDENALNAVEKYQDQYVAVTGRLVSIDGSGKYIELDTIESNFDMQSVKCLIQTTEQKEVVKNLAKEDIILVKGKVIEIDKWLDSYKIQIDSLEKQ